MQDSETKIAIETVGLSKCYEIYDSPSHRLWQGLSLGKRKFFREFWALRDVSLHIKKGETFGIVGRNGAGKSTLLQLISGILTPTSGSVKINGRVSALLELGAGLNPEFNGLDNIRVSATILGMSQTALESKIDKIIEFAALGEFIHQPVKHYSSGMVMRLAFAVAIHFDPDVLIVDEALAVGDELFQLKCIRRIQEIKENGTTILFVSHSTHLVNQICDRAVLIDKGRAVVVGTAKEVSERYTKLLFSLETNSPPQSTEAEVLVQTPTQQQASNSPDQQKFRVNTTTSEERRPHGYIAEVGIIGYDYRNLVFQSSERVKFHMRVNFRVNIHDVIMGMMITTSTGVDCYHTNLLCRDEMIEVCRAGENYVVTFEMPLNFNPGSYIAVFDCQYDLRSTPKLVDIFYEALHFTVRPDRLIGDGGVAALAAKIVCQSV